MKAAVIRFPGSNREFDVARALQLAADVHVDIVWHDEDELPAGVDIVVLPGGFSYGDYLRCGAIAAHSRVMGSVRGHAARGGYVLGICNGFQILCEAGLLPGVLMRNAQRTFVCRMQHLRVEAPIGALTGQYLRGQIVRVAVAHGEGNFVAEDAVVDRLESEGRVAFRYCDAFGDVHRENPNGSTNAIAGIYSERFNVLGMMPHPENAVDGLAGGTDGRSFFLR
jgi:phosphoribosylformylglycinamidine synthase subunit PurQ / glutaminase